MSQTTDQQAAEIRDIITRTYGKTDFVQCMADDVIEYIERNDFGARADSRERAVMLKCWDWMAGGSTAESTARKIEAVLANAPDTGSRSVTREQRNRYFAEHPIEAKWWNRLYFFVFRRHPDAVVAERLSSLDRRSNQQVIDDYLASKGL